jgi:hypothetical protein
LRDPLDGWARKDATLTDPHSAQQSAVDVTGLGDHVVETLEATQDVES